MPLVITLGLILLTLGLVEGAVLRRNLRRIPVRILVNGTRGKSTVTRLVAGALREAGLTTIAKTTGSAARLILEDGSEKPVRRPFGARITEQKSLAALAAKRRADALVVECMALRAESQAAMRRHLVRPTICVITNARVDHVEEMGGTPEDVAAVLSLSIPEGCTLITAEPLFRKPVFGGAAGKVVVLDGSSPGAEALERFSYPVFAENAALALGVAEELGIDRETALRGMAKAAPDIGVQRILAVDLPAFRVVLVNAFAANDPRSTLLVWEAAGRRLPGDLPVVLLYNNRPDREYRIREFAQLARNMGELCLVAATGRNARKAAGRFSALGLETLAFDAGTDCEALLSAVAERVGGSYAMLGAGNFHGMGEALTEYCGRRGRPL